MDFDIPLPDELEWLESHTHFSEDDFEILHPQEQTDVVSQSPPLCESNAHKRLRSESPQSLVDLTLPDDKRSKIDDDVADNEEEWLKYSPPREEIVVEEAREKIVSRYVSEIDGEFVPVTAPSGGDRVYAKFCRARREERGKNLNVRPQSKGLISESVDVLLRKLEQEAFTKALQASSESQSDVEVLETGKVHGQLWVDKYAPSSFTELLSDEHTNREVLLWLKQWDSVVFGSEIRSTSEEVFSALRRHSSISQHKPSDSTFQWKNRGRWTPGNFRHVSNANNKNSNSRGIQEMWNKKSRHTGPPEQKILLLCGPPGLGKTTLAHVAAKHCGYRVVEVNASDDRSSSTIESKILDVVQMDSVMADSRPKCLVIDEIDGALSDGRGAVEVILKMVAAEKKVDAATENAGKGEQSKRESSKKGHKAATLLRPVICICNDQYAPALRPLRQVAKVHIFVQPTVSRIVSRLKHICSKEGMKTSSIALTALADYTECDIRSCLNTLQFLNKKKETLNMTDIGTQVIGRKDISKGVFDIWKEIFQKRKSKPERNSYGNSNSMPNEMEFLHSLVSNRGDYDIIFDGIHENILHLQYHDPLMQKTVKCFNSLGISDVMQQYVMRTQQMHLYAYQSPVAITVHRLVAQVQKPNIEWPKSYQRYRTTLMEKTDTLRSWQTKMPPYITRHLSTKSFVEDTISSFLHILSPANLKPVASHLLSEKEKHDFSQLVSTMVSYAITYKNIKACSPSSKEEQEATLDTLPLSFDPPLCDFISFKGYNSGHYVLPLPMKQILVHEVEKQKILQVSKSVHVIDGCHKENPRPTREKNSVTKSAKIDRVVAFAFASENGQKTVNPIQCNPNGSKTSKALDSSAGGSAIISLNGQGNVKKPSRGSISFFDRFRKSKGKDLQNEGNGIEKGTSERDSRPLLFKFNEGFTNAIKKPVRMREFL